VARAGSEGGGRALRVGAWLFAGMAAAAAGMVPFLPTILVGDDRAYLPDGLLERMVIVTLVVAVAASLAIAAWRQAFVTGTVAATLLIAAVMILEGVSYPVRYARANDLRPLAEAAARLTPPGTAVIAHPDARLSLDFYVRRPVLEAVTPEATANLVARTGGAVVTARSHWPALAAVLPPSARVAATAAVGGRDYVVIAP
jgi:hypothetical protein